MKGVKEDSRIIAILLSNNYTENHKSMIIYNSAVSGVISINLRDIEKAEILKEVFDKYTPEELRQIFNL